MKNDKELVLESIDLLTFPTYHKENQTWKQDVPFLFNKNKVELSLYYDYILEKWTFSEIKFAFGEEETFKRGLISELQNSYQKDGTILFLKQKKVKEYMEKRKLIYDELEKVCLDQKFIVSKIEKKIDNEYKKKYLFKLKNISLFWELEMKREMGVWRTNCLNVSIDEKKQYYDLYSIEAIEGIERTKRLTELLMKKVR